MTTAGAVVQQVDLTSQGVTDNEVNGLAFDAARTAASVGRLYESVVARRRPHQRWSAQKDAALIAYDDGMVGHGRHVRAARGA